jgi:hypothetical protein
MNGRVGIWDAVVIAVAYIVYIAVIVVGPVVVFRKLIRKRKK